MDPTPDKRRGKVYWTGVTLLILWNAAMLLFAIAQMRQYARCMAEDGFNLCFNFAGPTLAVLVAVDAVVTLIVMLIVRLRGGRTRPPH
jgi:hypothetical protein